MAKAELSITGFGGVGEIGGTKILLKNNNTNLFFDFGFPFKKRARYFEEFLNPRPGAGLLDLMEMGLLPIIDGIYRTDLVKKQLWDRFIPDPSYQKLSVDGVLLSHAHLDHSGYISFLRDDIPIYSSTTTAFISKAMQDSAPPNFEKEVCHSLPKGVKSGYLRSAGTYKPRPFAFLDNPILDEPALEFWITSSTRKKPISTNQFKFNPEKIGNLNFKSFPVDHSIPGATAFAVETSLGWVSYTGDLRFHGGQSHQTEKFVQSMAKIRPYILLCEGTRCEDDRGATEQDAYENCLREVLQAEGLVIADFGSRNVERLLMFYNIAREAKRNLVIMGKDAYLLDAMRLASGVTPAIDDMPDILIYQDFKSRLSPWESAIRNRYHDRLISPTQVRTDADCIVLCFSVGDLNDLIDIVPRGGTYIYSSSEVFDEEGAMDMRRLNNWISHFGMKAKGLPLEEFNWAISENEKGLHASGHAGGKELLDLIRRINPQILIPIHTENPMYFAENLHSSGIDVRIPVEGESMTFS